MADFGITEALAAVGLSEAATAGTAAATAAAAVPAAAASTAAAAGTAAAGTAAAGTAAAGTAAASTFPSLATIATYGGPILTAGGTLLSAQAQGRAADYQEALAKAQAADLEAKGVQEGAASQQKAIQLDRQKQYLLSQYQARMAAGGTEAEGGDQTLADLAGLGEYNILTSILAGRQAGADRSRQAAIDRFSGANIAASALPAQAGTILGGLGSFLNQREARAYYRKIGEAPTAATL